MPDRPQAIRAKQVYFADGKLHKLNQHSAAKPLPTSNGSVAGPVRCTTVRYKLAVGSDSIPHMIPPGWNQGIVHFLQVHL